MNPEEYLKEYLRPMRESAAPDSSKPGTAPDASTSGSSTSSLPHLSPERYYSDIEQSPYMFNFDMDLLTRDELLWLIGEIGGVDPANLKPGQLLGRLRQGESISNDRRDLLVERERQISEQASLLDERIREIERLRNVLQEPSYRVYRTLLMPLRLARRLIRFAKRRLLL
ncbi:MAG: hypothetical protein ACYC6O_10280 [Thermoleophilia bacterium]